MPRSRAGQYNAGMVHEHDPVPAHVRDTIDLWVSDFLDRPAAREPAARVGEDASSVLSAFLEAACHGGKAPADLESGDLGHALLDHVAALRLSAPGKEAAPELVASFLGDLEDVGRLAEGRVLGAHVRALAPTFRERAKGRGPVLTRPAAKVGRNDPCPCGSGRKYKQCCLRTLD